MKKIAIMTAGGDCAGLNAAIKAVVMAAQNKNIVVVGIIDGFIGFVERKYVVLDNKSVENIERQGGTILGSSNKECPFYYPSADKEGVFEDRVQDSIEALRKIGVEGMIVVGGDGTLDSARVIDEAGMPTIGIPKTEQSHSFSEYTVLENINLTQATLVDKYSLQNLHYYQ